MIKITMANSQEIVWTKDQYDEYIYDGKCFVIIKGSQWVGIYNLDYVISIVIEKSVG